MDPYFYILLDSALRLIDGESYVRDGDRVRVCDQDITVYGVPKDIKNENLVIAAKISEVVSASIRQLVLGLLLKGEDVTDLIKLSVISFGIIDLVFKNYSSENISDEVFVERLRLNTLDHKNTTVDFPKRVIYRSPTCHSSDASLMI